jgi:hypothetical protein
MKFVCGNKYNNVIEVIKKQLKNNEINKNGLYINNYGLFQMLPVLYNCAKNKTFNKEELQKIFRAILRFEVYKIIRGKIRKSEKKEEFIKKSINDALGIDFEKYGTKLPELFQKNVDPKFHDQFHINKDIVKEYLKLKKEKKYSHPLYYKRDMNIKRWIYIKEAYFNQIRKFKKYF